MHIANALDLCHCPGHVPDIALLKRTRKVATHRPNSTLDSHYLLFKKNPFDAFLVCTNMASCFNNIDVKKFQNYLLLNVSFASLDQIVACFKTRTLTAAIAK